MASLFKTLTFSVILVFLLRTGVHGVPEPELEEMLSTLRSKGYNLFGNAISTSDLRFDILAGASFTFFAPTDAALFDLDMKATATEYIKTLSYHIVPRRLSVSDLRSLSSRSPLHTLFPNHSIRIAAKRSPEAYFITANGVDIIVPGLYYGRHVAVHGLSGIILSRRSNIGSRSNRAFPRESFPPRMNDADSYTNTGLPSAYEDGVPQGPQDLSPFTPATEPPFMRYPADLMSPAGYGYLVPETYDSTSPVEAPRLQESEYWFQGVPSPSEVPFEQSDSDGYPKGKRLEVVVGEMVSGLSWFSDNKAEEWN